MIEVNRKTTIVIVNETASFKFAFEGGNATKLKEVNSNFGTIHFYRVDSGATFVVDAEGGPAPSSISAYGGDFYDTGVIPVPVYGDTLIIAVS